MVLYLAVLQLWMIALPADTAARPMPQTPRLDRSCIFEVPLTLFCEACKVTSLAVLQLWMTVPPADTAARLKSQTPWLRSRCFTTVRSQPPTCSTCSRRPGTRRMAAQCTFPRR